MTAEGAEARVDVDALRRAVAVGEATTAELTGLVSGIGDLANRVRAGCGWRAVPGEALDDLGRLLALLVETGEFIDAVARSVVVVDAASSAPAARSIPWLDDDTDSWVVDLARMASGRPSPEVAARLLDVAPDLVPTLADDEFTIPNQIQLLFGDPERFAANWWRAAEGAGDTSLSVLLALAGIGSALAPGGDEIAEALTGRRAGEEIQVALAAGLQAAVFDPDTFVSSAVGTEQLLADPYRWFGSMLPELVLEAVTPAVPTLGRRAMRFTPPAATSLSPPSPRFGLVAGSVDDAGGGGFPDLEEFRRSESDWAPADPIVSRRQAPFESPENWVGDLNGDGSHVPGRGTNCVDCARATEANWRGQDANAAPLDDETLLGVPADRLEDWTGGRLVPATLPEIGQRLESLGPGSSAIVTSLWDNGAAHAYNAVNDGGIVKWVDAQTGAVTPWPPPYADQVEVSIVIWIDSNGRPQ